MPVLDVEVVCQAEPAGAATLARRLADGAAAVLGSPPGSAWVKLRFLPAGQYAENGPVEGALPVFVRILQRQPPAGGALDQEAAALTRVIAEAVGRPADRVHVEYLPAAAGRQAFGGVLVR